MSIEIPKNVEEAIQAASKATGVSVDQLRAFANIESGYGKNTRSATEVRGLFQITGATYKAVMNEEYSEKFDKQALAAARYIKLLEKEIGTKNQSFIAIGYNAGGTVAKELYKATNGDATKLNYEMVRSSVAKHLGNLPYTQKYTIGDKVHEVLNYAPKFAKAIGDKNFKISEENLRETETKTETEGRLGYDPKDDFLLTMGASQQAFANLEKTFKNTSPQVLMENFREFSDFKRTGKIIYGK